MSRTRSNRLQPLLEGYLLLIYSATVGRLRSRRRRVVRRVLVVRLDHIGDLLMSTPALAAIRRKYPDAEITLATGEWNLPVIENNPNVDRVVVHNSSRYTRPPYSPHPITNLRQSLRGHAPDVVIGLRDDWATLTEWLRRDVQLIDRGRTQIRLWFERRRSGEAEQHETVRIREILAGAGIEVPPSADLEMHLSDSERSDAQRFLAEERLDGPFAVLQPAATVPLRQWFPDRYADVAHWLHRHHGLRIVIAGAPSEREQARDLADRIADISPVDISGRSSLREFAAIVERASLYVGSDGGAMHLATAVGTPTVALFGPGPYHGYYPVGRHVVGISHLFPCAPCDQVTCVRPNDTCMMAITVEEVVEASRKVLGRSADQ